MCVLNGCVELCHVNSSLGPCPSAQVSAQTVSSILFRSVRFALLNSEAGAAATPLPRRYTEPTKAADPDIDSDNENDIDSDNESDKNDDNDNNDDHENVEKPKRGKPQNSSSFPSARVLTSQVPPSTRSALAVHAFQTQYPRVKLLARGKFLVPLAPRVALVATRDTTLTIGKTPKYTVRKEDASG